MCQFKGAILLKDRVFMPAYDSHQKMLEELGIEDTRENAERLFVRAELLPPRGDVFRPVEHWKFHVDQDIVPDWFVREYEEKRMREAVAEWAGEHIYDGVSGIQKIVEQGTELYFFRDCKDVSVVARESSTATVWALGSSTATVEAWGSSTATVEAWESSKIKLTGHTIGEIHATYFAEITKNVILENAAVLLDHQNKTVYTATGDWEAKKL